MALFSICVCVWEPDLLPSSLKTTDSMSAMMNVHLPISEGLCQLPWLSAVGERGHSAVRGVRHKLIHSQIIDHSFWSFTSSLEGTNQLIKKRQKSKTFTVSDRRWENSISQSLCVFYSLWLHQTDETLTEGKITHLTEVAAWHQMPNLRAARNPLATVTSVTDIHN